MSLWGRLRRSGTEPDSAASLPRQLYPVDLGNR